MQNAKQNKKTILGKFLRVGLVAVTLIVVAILLFGPVSTYVRSFRITPLLDFGHFVLFAVVTLLFWWVFRRNVWLAGCVAVALAGICEVAQRFFFRSTNAPDFLRGLLGCLVVMVGLYALKRPRTWRRIGGCSAAVVILSAWPILEVTPTVMVMIDSYRTFPVISDFSSPWHARRWEFSHHDPQRVRLPDTPFQWTGRFEFVGGGEKPFRALLIPLMHDWTDYRRICIQFSLPDGPGSVELLLRSGMGKKPAYRKYPWREYAAGTHTLVADLDSSEGEASDPAMDFAYVRHVRLSVQSGPGEQDLLIHRIYLE